ncbi:heterotrimeric G-protein alpha subunit, GPA3-like protein [Spinellus fusiger]|nr:heterotrimeric G-protein alpha subunit, GPA3-like protein [Spinellus fusiger]
MGLCLSSETQERRDISRRIDNALMKDRKRLRNECKILLLGSGESGKSTIVKQMKIIHQNGFSSEELTTWRSIVYKNIIRSMLAIVQAMEMFEYQYQWSDNKHHAKQILGYGVDASQPLESEIVHSIQSLWEDPAVLRMINEKGSQFYMMDTASYFFNEMDRIGAREYQPTTQDVLCARLKTSGILETRFRMAKMNIHMFDVGGQRSERKKWIHCFEGVTAIIFCVALSEYDQVLLEECTQNRMVESLQLFDSIVNSRWFLRTAIVLFLNKIDVFESKLQYSPLRQYFTDYKGGSDPSKAAKFILRKFDRANRAGLSLYPHLTLATDTSNIRLVFTAIRNTILQNTLKDSGIL